MKSFFFFTRINDDDTHCSGIRVGISKDAAEKTIRKQLELDGIKITEKIFIKELVVNPNGTIGMVRDGSSRVSRYYNNID
jgi:hypothetical protein